MKYLLISNDIGGVRVGLSRAGWEAEGSVFFDDNVKRIYRQCFSEDVVLEIEKLLEHRQERVDAVVIRGDLSADPVSGQVSLGGTQKSTKVIALRRIVSEIDPKVIVFELGESYRRYRFGFLFAAMLAELTPLGFSITWMTLNARDFASVQDRQRLLVVAFRSIEYSAAEEAQGFWKSVWAPSTHTCGVQSRTIEWGRMRRGEIEEVLEVSRPRIGTRMPRNRTPFLSFGITHGRQFGSCKFKVLEPGCEYPQLGEVLGVEEKVSGQIASVRFLSRKGVKGLGFKADALAHSVGSGISAWPLVAIPDCKTSTSSLNLGESQLFNWFEKRDGYFVARLTPERSVRLFGPGLESIEMALSKENGSLMEKYGLVSRIAIPEMLSSVAQQISRVLRVS